MTDLDQIRETFKLDRYATEATGIEILEASEGFSKVRLKLDERHENASGRVMGAVYYTMADFAFAVAANADIHGKLTVTLTSSISFLSGCRGDTLFAEAHIIKEGNKTSFCRIDVTDNLGTEVATVTSTGYRMNRPMLEEGRSSLS